MIIKNAHGEQVIQMHNFTIKEMHQLQYACVKMKKWKPITGYSSTTAVTPPTLWDEVSALPCHFLMGSQTAISNSFQYVWPESCGHTHTHTALHANWE